MVKLHQGEWYVTRQNRKAVCVKASRRHVDAWLVRHEDGTFYVHSPDGTVLFSRDHARDVVKVAL